VAVRRLLIDADRGAQPFDEIDIGSVDLAEKLAGVSAEALDIAALALGEDRVEGEARLATAGKPGEHHHAVARDREVDILQIVHSRASDADVRVRRITG